MRVYFKNGQSIRINQQIANKIVEMLDDLTKGRSTDDALIATSLRTKDVRVMINIREVIAIR